MKLLYIIIAAYCLLLCSCRSQMEQTQTDFDYTSYLEEQSSHTDSLFATLLTGQEETIDRLSNLKVENTTTYYTLPDSGGKQYPIVISTTKADKTEQEQEQSYTELSASMAIVQSTIDSLVTIMDSALQQSAETKELSWWDAQKHNILMIAIGAITVLVPFLIYRLRNK